MVCDPRLFVQEENVSTVEQIADDIDDVALDQTLICFVLVDIESSKHAFCSRYDFGPWPLLSGIQRLPDSALQVRGAWQLPICQPESTATLPCLPISAANVAWSRAQGQETCVQRCSCCCRCWQGRVQSSPTASSLTSCPCQWWSTPSSMQPAVGHPSSLTLVGMVLQQCGWLCRGWLCSNSCHMHRACQGSSGCITSAGALRQAILLPSDDEHQYMHVCSCDGTAGVAGCSVSMPAPCTTAMAAADMESVCRPTVSHHEGGQQACGAGQHDGPLACGAHDTGARQQQAVANARSSCCAHCLAVIALYPMTMATACIILGWYTLQWQHGSL